MEKAVAGKDDTLWSFPPEIYYDLGPALRRPTLGHLSRHSYIVMTIILRRSLNLTNRTLRDKILLSDFVSTFVLLQVN